MNPLDTLTRAFGAPRLTRGRLLFALAIAIGADLLQIALMPVAWTFAQSAVDVVAMVLVVLVLGFHPLLLPTFIIEFVPGLDVIPTWTACVLAVIALRKTSERNSV